MLRGAPKRNAEGTPLRVLSKHGSDLVLAQDEEAEGFRFCHPDHSSRSLTCGNAVSCARCSIPHGRHRGLVGRSGMPAPPRQAEEHQPPSTTKQTTRHSRVPSGHCVPPSTTKRSFRAGLSASQESLTIRSRKLARLRTVAHRPLGADPVDPRAANSHERSCFLDRPPSQLLNAARRPADSFDDARPATIVGRGSPAGTAKTFLLASASKA